MSDKKGADSDPSMDDILASIRKIISDDEARAQVTGQGTSQAGSAASATPGDATITRGTRASQANGREDVLLLTDLIEDPKPSADPPPTPIPVPRIDPVHASEMPQPNVEIMSPPISSTPPAPTPGASEPSSLVESTVAGATSSAFERLSQAMKERSAPPPQLAPSSDPGPSLGTGGKTIEDLVKEMLRPMLKDWLDRNLPPMVERLVESEIERLTRR